jgi:hypothetical protein
MERVGLALLAPTSVRCKGVASSHNPILALLRNKMAKKERKYINLSNFT